MTLDPRPSDAELLGELRRRSDALCAIAATGKASSDGRPVVNGVALGPDSPLRKVRVRKSKEQLAAERQARLDAHAGDPIDPAGEMNKTERRRAEELEAARLAGNIERWFFGEIRLGLGARTTYTPDFLIVYPPVDRQTGATNALRFVFEEIKGHWEDDARVKIKVAARRYPWFRFRALIRRRKKQGGGWHVEAIKP